jgi:hypothetical protein
LSASSTAALMLKNICAENPIAEDVFYQMSSLRIDGIVMFEIEKISVHADQYTSVPSRYNHKYFSWISLTECF